MWSFIWRYISAFSTPKVAWGHHQSFHIQMAQPTAIRLSKIGMIAGSMVISPPWLLVIGFYECFESYLVHSFVHSDHFDHSIQT